MEEKSLTEQLLENFKQQEEKHASKFWKEMKETASFRPTIYIGVGGFGCGVVSELKRAILDLIPDDQIRQGFAFIGIDTHPSEKGDILTTNEYIPVIGITPHVVSNQPENKGYLDWYNKLHKGDWKAKNITGGANQVRAVGRLAFLYPPTLNKFISILTNAFNQSNALRKLFNINSNPKVYIVSSLAGGTGSGMLLDVSIIVSKFLSDRANARFDLQCILATADPLEGTAPQIQIPDLYANTYSTLKDIYGLSENDIHVSYKVANFENFQAGMTHLPNPIFLITGQNKEGKLVLSDFDELRSIAVSYLLFEIHTPIVQGGAKVQDKENDNSDRTGNGLMKTIFSSFGAIRFGVPSKEIKETFTQIIMLNALDKELGNMISAEDVFTFINDQKLSEAGSDQLQETIRKGKDNKDIRIIIDVFSEVDGLSNDQYAKKCKGIVDVKTTRLKNDYYDILEENANLLFRNCIDKLNNSLESILNSKSVASCAEFINQLNTSICTHQSSLVNEIAIGRDVLAKAKERTEQSIGSINLAAQSGFMGRSKRVKLAISTFEADLQAELNQQIIVWSMEKGLDVYASFLSKLSELHAKWNGFSKQVESRKSFLSKTLDNLLAKIQRMSDVNRREKGNRFSIVDVKQVLEIYKKYIGEKLEGEMANRLRSDWRKKDAIKDMVSSEDVWCMNNQFNLRNEIEQNLSSMSIISAIEMFYSDGLQRQGLFENIMALGSPLFPLNTDYIEEAYLDAWIVAVNPELKDDLMDMLGRYIPAGAGKSMATYPSKDEVIIYSLQHGFTPHSLSRMSHYFSHYECLMRKFKDSKIKVSRPINSRLETEEWPELIPISKEEETIRKWFAVGRALSYLFPSKIKENGEPDVDKNEAFIYNRGNYYYLNITIDHRTTKVKLGNGLRASIENFGENSDYQEYVQNLCETFISEQGVGVIRKRLQEEYLPVIESEIERTRTSNDQERVVELDDLFVAIRKYIDKDLIVSRV